MRTRGPILTLLAVVGVAFVLLAVNMTTGREEATDANVRAAGTTTAPPAVPPAPEPPVPPVAAPPQAAPDIPEQASYAGRTSGRKAGEATVEIAVRDGAVTAYLCDGKKLESWLKGNVTGSTLDLHGKGTDELTGTLRSGELTGTVSLSGVQWQFSAKPGKAPAAEKRAAKAAAAARAPAAPAPAYPDPTGSGSTSADPAPTYSAPTYSAPTGYPTSYTGTADSAAGTRGAGR
ncbi:MAG TPA: hypothetical protein VH141_24855 [Pseudonocardia sp.]|jgi:hypothetical protein|nr:hypothetical protein [Pseudonocardia sp.]